MDVCFQATPRPYSDPSSAAAAAALSAAATGISLLAAAAPAASAAPAVRRSGGLRRPGAPGAAAPAPAGVPSSAATTAAAAVVSAHALQQQQQQPTAMDLSGMRWLPSLQSCSCSTALARTALLKCYVLCSFEQASPHRKAVCSSARSNATRTRAPVRSSTRPRSSLGERRYLLALPSLRARLEATFPSLAWYAQCCPCLRFPVTARFHADSCSIPAITAAGRFRLRLRLVRRREQAAARAGAEEQRPGRLAARLFVFVPVCLWRHFCVWSQRWSWIPHSVDDAFGRRQIVPFCRGERLVPQFSSYVCLLVLIPLMVLSPYCSA